MTMPSRSGFGVFGVITGIILSGAICAMAAGDIGDQATSRPSAPSGPASRPAALPTTQPITTADTPAAKLLKKWWSEGTAAGNVGDWYDNRDREHSGLKMANWPQLQKIIYDAQALAVRADWGAQRTIIPKVVFGNSSTSAGVTTGGSNVRMYYNNSQGLAFLYTQYTRNNIYMYPEHRDHDPGRNGVGDGYGDVYCTNTPFLISSQGSSGTDRPFMQAVANMLAAFRPEVKKKLIESGLLMPTIQMILRSTIKPVQTPEDYLTGKAHPTVFEGSGVDDVKMVEMAHGIAEDSIPPMVQLKVVKEDAAAAGRDPAEPSRSEKLADTPAVIARIWRGGAYTRAMTVSAEASADINKRPLTYRWAVLRGDPERIKITPDKTGATAEITVQYPYRRPVAKDSPMESNRVDIGVFVNNGKYYSAPGFITFYGLDNEARTYDGKGRLLEIAYNAGDTTLTIHWPAFFDLLAPQADLPAAKFIKEKFTKEQIDALLKAAAESKSAIDAAAAAKKKLADTQAAAKKAGDEVQAAEARLKNASATKPAADKDEIAKLTKAVQAAKDAQKTAGTARSDAQKQSADADKAVETTLARKRDDLGGSAKEIVEGLLNAMLDDADFYRNSEKAIQPMLTDKSRGVLATARKRMIAYGLIKDVPEGIVFDPLLGPDAKLADPLPASGPAKSPADAAGRQFTRYERSQIQRFNGEMLGGVIFPDAITATYRENYVDAVLAAPKPFRDVFRYDAAGKRTAWIRFDGKTRTELNPDSQPAEK
ncbi:MAG: hypothetical protein HZA50_18445 [Planctomycetes bacterium]|nr:hypothetical protein [Planctomycetota bacterium]